MEIIEKTFKVYSPGFTPPFTSPDCERVGYIKIDESYKTSTTMADFTLFLVAHDTTEPNIDGYLAWAMHCAVGIFVDFWIF